MYRSLNFKKDFSETETSIGLAPQSGLHIIAKQTWKRIRIYISILIGAGGGDTCRSCWVASLRI